MPIFTFARAMPIVRTNRPIRSFCSAKTCSTSRTDGRFGGVGAARGFRHWTALWLLAMHLGSEAVFLPEGLIGRRAISRIGPDGSRRVGLVEKALAQAARPRTPSDDRRACSAASSVHPHRKSQCARASIPSDPQMESKMSRFGYVTRSLRLYGRWITVNYRESFGLCG